MPPPPPRPKLVAKPHYELGAPYARKGYWFYPAESYALQATGIAAIDTAQDGLTADGELRDPTALAAAMQTIQPSRHRAGDQSGKWPADPGARQ